MNGLCTSCRRVVNLNWVKDVSYEHMEKGIAYRILLFFIEFLQLKQTFMEQPVTLLSQRQLICVENSHNML